MNIDLNDPFQVLLGELRYHAQVVPRHRAVLPGRSPVKGLSEDAARDLARSFGGHVERSEVWVLPDDWELLGPWERLSPSPNTDQRSTA
ncbi:hypothetical protein GCM10010399_44110 [Dactylosporangium fulvum]|uniref:Uncharacterized protein n=1 Tax=Dactylosporangium fulvum TaxID=53359 RepID=A0ABY5W7S0_9ACTN|nr:hypothetical protein [Dactylosporangium fulvum]UWP85922.1 hypothetical protein Dfulv_17385 [Dactylosporangium fulvum]